MQGCHEHEASKTEASQNNIMKHILLLCYVLQTDSPL